MPSRFYYQNNKEQYIQAPHDYYNSNKDSILKRLKNKYNVLTAEDREKNNKYAKNWYNNLPDDKKKKKKCKEKHVTIDITLGLKNKEKNIKNIKKSIKSNVEKK